MILITRPQSEARLLARELQKLNLSYSINSLVSFEYEYKKIFHNKNKIFIISSLQTVRTLKLYKKKYSCFIKESNFLVVGKKVSSELKLIGAVFIKKVFKNSDSLLRDIIKNDISQFQYEYLCGSIVNDDFIRTLKSQKINLRRVILYRPIPAKKLSSKSVSFIKNQKIKTITLYSAYSSKVLLKLLKKHNLLNYAKDVDIVCLSERIGNPILKTGCFRSVEWPRYPDQASLIKLLSHNDELKSELKIQ